MERFLHLLAVRLLRAGSHVANQRAKSSLNLCHWFTSALAGGPCTRFVVGASERKATDSKENARIASSGRMETRLAAAEVPWKWMTFGVFLFVLGEVSFGKNLA